MLSIGAAAAVTWAVDAVLLARVHAGVDNAVRLSVLLPYVGVDGSYTLARALGISALVFAYLAVLLGLLASGGGGADRSGPALVPLLHRQVAVLTLILVVAHAVVPFSSAYTPYGGWKTQFVPFGQPWQWGTRATNAESLGILALYLAVLVGPTFYLTGRSRRAWLVVHRLALAVYALSVLHAFFLGTDFLVRGPVRIALLAAQLPVIVLVAHRLRLAISSAGRIRSAVTGVGIAGCAGLVALTVLVATGRFAGGMKL
jgi:predicted ferric reductase